MEKTLYIDIELVKKLMKEQKFSIKTLAENTGISEFRLRKFLSGADQGKMKVDILRALAIALKVKAQSLFYGEVFAEPLKKEQIQDK